LDEIRPPDAFDLVEAGAGNGRLSADILEAARHRHPAFLAAIRLHLVEASESARAAQSRALGDLASRLASSSASLPPSFSGVLLANELLDALPVHQVVMREDGLREVYVDLAPDGAGLATREGPPSTPQLEAYLSRAGARLEPGWRAEINLRAVEFVRHAARRLGRGFIIFVDYGHEARDLYSVAHGDGTLTAFARHVAADRREPLWLEQPGGVDLTAHVDFTTVRATAESEGLTTLGFMDQTYFLLGLVEKRGRESFGERARQLSTLVMPGGIGSTHKVLILGKGVGTPGLAGCSFAQRVT
jgi:SAM-dependent MidA family methyltransferase